MPNHARRSPNWVSAIQRRRNILTLGLGLVLVMVGVLVGGTTTRSPAPSVRSASLTSATIPARHSQRGLIPARNSQRALRTFLGADGVESSAMIAENRRAGTTAWEIPPTSAPGGIEGFASLDSAMAGQNLTLYVSTVAPKFHVVAYRMGYYQGLGARQVWTSPMMTGKTQPTCPLTPDINMVSCDNWSPSFNVPITSAFVPGDYLLKLVGSGGQQAYVPLTVWNPTSHATYLIMNRTFTEEGWNAYGGYSYYQGQGPCTLGSGPYPVCNRARVVSFDRPYDTGNGSSDFLSNEYPLVRFSEAHGLDVTYATDVTVDEHPTILLQDKALLSLDHDESWSYNELQAAQAAQAQGVNIAFFGAAALVRHVRLQPSPLGTDREEVDYRDSAEDPLNGNGNPMLVTGNTWDSPPTNWNSVPFVGEEYSGYLTTGSAAFVVADSSAWVYKGTGLQNGSQLPGVITSDIDHVSADKGTPSNLQVLGHSPVPLSEAYTNQGQWGPYTYSDMGYYTVPTSGAGVIDTGTTNWIYAMTPCSSSVPNCSATPVSRITGNILWLFGQGPTGHLAPSVSNRQTILPAGS
jgi:hypothetical protein